MFVCLCVRTRAHAYVRACACVTPEIVRVHNIREEGDTTTSFIKHTV